MPYFCAHMLKNRLAIYLLLGGVFLLTSGLLARPGASSALVASQLVAGVMVLTFVAAGPFLDNRAENDPDAAYLYYLGVSGARMLIYMFGLAIALYLMPAWRQPKLVLGLTLTFCLLTGAEVSFFLHKLRKIYKRHT